MATLSLLITTMLGLKLTERSELEEIMDNLSVSGALIDQTLKELEVINKWLGGNQVTLTGLNELTKGHDITELHIADLGCGRGDMLKRVANWGRNQGIRLQLTGIDANPFIIDHARNNCSCYPEIEFQVANILDDSFQRKQFSINNKPVKCPFSLPFSFYPLSTTTFNFWIMQSGFLS